MEVLETHWRRKSGHEPGESACLCVCSRLLGASEQRWEQYKEPLKAKSISATLKLLQITSL